ncbi:protochlorophyllide reductase [Actinoalloteichus hoggarensis]|uniref:Fatty acyl-CoA reductase n=1 Tax=Actinoalloteichus hoggarensis TaxID=1470176 RepID=A0A221W8I8_9PSEU|nr:oxidoreductase [Actinoalloteichus hoggarensis]ASO22218.1 Fatty acyl-CoA reductase [Actinoalloteichus hoggarensis]MBB5923697.1 protochlorophyllide reductase [Actinoalloteichus hoggarensis]
MAKWTITDIPDQSGRVALITGANSGIGRATAFALAARNATVLVAVRSVDRGAEVVEKITSVGGRAEVLELDLTDLASVRRAASEVEQRAPEGLDLLINNAGVMATPLKRTVEGFELQFATNHLGHAALTWLLMPRLRLRAGSRVVTVSSFTHKGRGLDLDDPNFDQRRYNSGMAYSQSKLANLLFMFELDRRLRAEGADVLSVAAHPGLVDTELATNSARMRASGFMEKAAGLFSRTTGQSADQGALPLLYAATMAEVRGGDYFGPDGVGELRGGPKRVATSAEAQSISDARRLWEVTAKLTSVTPDPA